MRSNSTPHPDAHGRAAIWMLRRVRARGRGRYAALRRGGAPSSGMLAARLFV